MQCKLMLFYFLSFGTCRLQEFRVHEDFLPITARNVAQLQKRPELLCRNSAASHSCHCYIILVSLSAGDVTSGSKVSGNWSDDNHCVSSTRGDLVADKRRLFISSN